MEICALRYIALNKNNTINFIKSYTNPHEIENIFDLIRYKIYGFNLNELTGKAAATKENIFFKITVEAMLLCRKTKIVRQEE